MLKNYLKVAIRSLKRQPAYTTLNIVGLTVGIASSLLILLYIFYETSFDKHHEKADRIYRISSDIKEPDNAFKWAVTQLPLGYTLKNDYGDEVEQYVRFVPNGRTRLEKDLNNYFEENFYYVDSTVFQVFDFEFTAGNKETALDAPNSIVLNETVAKKIFKGENPIGQTLKSDGDRTYQVTGVFKDMPSNSHIIADVMVSAQTIIPAGVGNWGGFNIYTYVLLQPNVTPKDFQPKLAEILEKHVDVIFKQLNIEVKYAMLPIKTIHLESDFQGEPVPTGEMSYIYIFGAVGLFLIVIACINYMNLATARSARRAMEVGIRKVMGAQRGSLIGQFLTESVLITLASTLLSIGIIVALVPTFNNMLGTNLEVSALLDTNIILSLVGILLITGVAGGSYPAFFLSSFRPVVVMKGNAGKSGNNILRKSLVTLQFAISIFMLIGTLVIYNQMQYVQNKDLGFDKEQVMNIQLNNRNAREQWPVLKNKLLQNANIESVATASTVPGNGFGKNIFSMETEEGVMEQKGVDNYRVDYDYFSTLGIEVVEGRGFSLDYPSDSARAVMVNEAMVSRMNWSEAIGKKVTLPNDSIPAVVIGVVKDFHQQSLYAPIEALMFLPARNNGAALIKINGDLSGAIASVKATWNELFPTIPFEFTFIDEAFMEQYETDQLRGKLFLGFSMMTILIACLGQLGLASYTAEQRSKEISIRKVLGARTQGLISLLVRDFVLLVIIAAVPASVVAWFVMNKWLDDFEFHVTIGFPVFLIVLVCTIVITVLTTGYHAMKSATANPAERLKYE
jgi:putative ABC transport system permease protein